MSFVCDQGSEPHLVLNSLDRYDVRIEVRRTDGRDRPECITIGRTCKAHIPQALERFKAQAQGIQEAML
jgi:hypothetical protein